MAAPVLDLLAVAVTWLQLDDLIFGQLPLVVVRVNLDDRYVAGYTAQRSNLRDGDRGLSPWMFGAFNIHEVLRAFVAAEARVCWVRSYHRVRLLDCALAASP